MQDARDWLHLSTWCQENNTTVLGSEMGASTGLNSQLYEHLVVHSSQGLATPSTPAQIFMGSSCESEEYPAGLRYLPRVLVGAVPSAADNSSADGSPLELLAGQVVTARIAASVCKWATFRVLALAVPTPQTSLDNTANRPAHGGTPRRARVLGDVPGAKKAKVLGHTETPLMQVSPTAPRHTPTGGRRKSRQRPASLAMPDTDAIYDIERTWQSPPSGLIEFMPVSWPPECPGHNNTPDAAMCRFLTDRLLSQQASGFSADLTRVHSFTLETLDDSRNHGEGGSGSVMPPYDVRVHFNTGADAAAEPDERPSVCMSSLFSLSPDRPTRRMARLLCRAVQIGLMGQAETGPGSALPGPLFLGRNPQGSSSAPIAGAVACFPFRVGVQPAAPGAGQLLVSVLNRPGLYTPLSGPDFHHHAPRFFNGTRR